jgi:5'-deoxynucleotidase YfbR-like HD superfamily hydrolase
MNADPFIGLQSKAKMWFERPHDSQFTLSDLVLGLSNLCRFGGQTFFHYSVAQHSCYVHDIVPDEFKKWGLMHDAAEALMGVDLPRPFKYRDDMTPFRKIEAKVQDVVAERFALPHYIPLEVKRADIQMFMTEQLYFFNMVSNGNMSEEELLGIVPAEVKIEQWSQVRAQLEFLKRFQQNFDTQPWSSLTL